MSKTNYEPVKEKIKVEPKEYITAGEQKGFILQESGKVKYQATGKSYNFSDPEEKVRASFYVELIQKYKYLEKRLDTEVVVPRRTPSDSADIVVYEDDEQKKPYIVVECKKDGISQSEINQSIEQAFGNANSLRAKYAIVVAGNVRIAFDVAGFNPRERDKNIISDIPIRYGKITKYKYKKGDETWDLQPADLKALQDKFQQCHDILWEGGKRNPAEAFDEMSKLMFCKIQDERFITEIDEYYKFQIGTYESIKEVAARIIKIYKDAQLKQEDVFEQPIKASDEVIYSIVEKLQSISLVKTDLDAKGKAFEKFLDRVFKGSMGQYFTPRTIVEFMVNMLEPTRYDLVIDPACGSGGFLLYVMDYIRKFVEARFPEHEAREIWRNHALYKIFGIEINSQISRVAMMNMIIHEDGHTNIENNDALDDYDNFDKRKAIKQNKYSLLLTNPPFGASIKEQEHKYLNNFILGGKKKKRKNQNTEILFIERCLDLLVEGGRMGIVLPESIFTNSTNQYVRDFILENAKILAVIKLPNFTFVPSGAGVSASLLFLEKIKEQNRKRNYKIFMSLVSRIGYDTNGRPDINNLPKILEEYKKFKDSQRVDDNKRSYVINSSELNSLLSAVFYQPKYTELIHKIKRGSYWKLEEVCKKEKFAIVDGPFRTQLHVSEYTERGIPLVKSKKCREKSFH
jgi:type I restriction enzyme M protein